MQATCYLPTRSSLEKERLLHRVRGQLLHPRSRLERLHVGIFHRLLRQETDNRYWAAVDGNLLLDFRAVYLLRLGFVVEVLLER